MAFKFLNDMTILNNILSFIKGDLLYYDSSYTTSYYNIEIYLILYILICSLLLILATFFSGSIIQEREKLSEYECGFDPFDNATRRPFDVHFYIVGILFLIFDVEIALMFPWVLIYGCKTNFAFDDYTRVIPRIDLPGTNGMTEWVVMLIFLFIITVGFFYEWHRGALRWPQIIV